MTGKKVLVIGLDGATWDLMRPWAEKGILPTFKKLMENGVYGNLESTIPPITGPAWVSFATGKNPGKHGCYDFVLPGKTLNDKKPITTKDIHEKTFYETLNEKGKKCILINLPCSFPPRINDITITSLLTQGDDFIFPPELVDEIQELKNYRISPDMSLMVDGKVIDHINDIRRLEKNRFECAKKLFEKDWDFFFLLFSGTDWIQHQIYDKLVYGMFDENSDPIRAYKEIDKYMGWFIDNAPQNVNILFMSDHGFGLYEKTFGINKWLKEEGYLKVESGSRQTSLFKIGQNVKKARDERINIKLPTFLSNYLKLFTWLFPFYRKLKSVLPIEVRTNFQPKLSETIAYSMTSVSSNFCGIYINDKKRFVDGKVEMVDYENIRTEIINKLKQLKDPKTGENIIRKIWKKEDVYFGSRLDAAPDILVMLLEEYGFNFGFFTAKTFSDKHMGKINGHALNGIFLAYGSNIKKGIEIPNAKIYDIAPTILYIFGIPIPKDMDGSVLKEVFEDDSELAEKEVVYQELEEKEKIKERIRKLKSFDKNDLRKI